MKRIRRICVECGLIRPALVRTPCECASTVPATVKVAA